MYSREGDTVTLTMTVKEYDNLNIALGYALAAAKATLNPALVPGWVKLMNSLNNGNAAYKTKEMP